MKQLFIILFSIFLSFNGFCQTNDGGCTSIMHLRFLLGNDDPPVNYGAMYTMLSCAGHHYYINGQLSSSPGTSGYITCDNYGGAEANFGDGYLDLAYNMFYTGILDPAVVAQVALDNVPANSLRDYVAFTVHIETETYDGFIGNTYNHKFSSITFEFLIFYPKPTWWKKNVLCSESYSKQDLFEVLPEQNISYTNEQINFSSGVNFVNNSITFPSVNQLETITYKAKVSTSLSNPIPNISTIPNPSGSINVKAVWQTPLRTILPANFLSFPSNILQSSPNITLNQFVQNYPPPVINEFVGPGVYLASGTYNDWLLYPPFAGGGQKNISYRTNNEGCFSDWADTTYYITPVPSVVNSPNVDFGYTFGSFSNQSHLGIWQPPYLDYEGSLEPGYHVFENKFHFLCSDSEYDLKVENPNQYLTYEWQSFFHNELYSTGTGTNFILNTPNSNSVNVNVPFQVFGTQTPPYNDNEMYNYVAYGGFATNYIGDPLHVFVRSKNSIGQYSSWKPVYFGVVKTPNFSTDLLLCSDTNHIEIVGPVYSETSFYYDSLNFANSRTMKLDYDNNGLWDFQGQITNYDNTLSQKVKDIRIQMMDSVKIFGHHVQTNSWGPIYHPYVSTVCYSEIDTLTIIKSPEFNVSFSAIGEIEYGTAVEGVVTGDYFSSADDVLWQWSDGSELYNSHSLWHFMNDLGSYSLTVTVVDSFGCSSSLNFDSLWFVPGGLSVDELISDEILIYPNPAADFVYVKNIDFTTDFELFDLLGKSHVITKSVDGKLLLPSVSNGLYFLRFSSSNKNYNIPLRINK